MLPTFADADQLREEGLRINKIIVTAVKGGENINELLNVFQDLKFKTRRFAD